MAKSTYPPNVPLQEQGLKKALLRETNGYGRSFSFLNWWFVGSILIFQCVFTYIYHQNYPNGRQNKPYMWSSWGMGVAQELAFFDFVTKSWFLQLFRTHSEWVSPRSSLRSKKSSHSLLHAVTRWWLRETKGNEHGVACWRRARERGFLASANHVVAAGITLFNMEKCLSWLNAGMCRPRVCLPCQAQLFARAGASQSCLCLFCFTTASPTTITTTPTPIATAAATASTAAASYCCCYCYFFRCDY